CTSPERAPTKKRRPNGGSPQKTSHAPPAASLSSETATCPCMTSNEAPPFSACGVNSGGNVSSERFARLRPVSSSSCQLPEKCNGSAKRKLTTRVVAVTEMWADGMCQAQAKPAKNTHKPPMMEAAPKLRRSLEGKSLINLSYLSS